MRVAVVSFALAGISPPVCIETLGGDQAMFGFHLSRPWCSAAALAGIGTLGFALGAWYRPSHVRAQNPVVPASTNPPSDYSQRVVAYIHGNIPVTREELGDFLIARYGVSKVEPLVNRRI